MPPLSSPPIKMFCSSISSQMYLKPMGVSWSFRPNFVASLSMSFVTEKVFAISPGRLPDEQGKDLVGIDECAVAVDGADAVAVAIGAQACIELPGEHRLPQGFD